MSTKYRDRVEVFGTKDGKIFGGRYTGDGTFGVFGGGLDGDSIVNASKKEYKEESGWSLKNVKRIPGKPLILPWIPHDGMNAKQKRRMKEFPGGTRTFYTTGELQRHGNKASGEDGQSGLTNKRLYTKDEIQNLMKPTKKFDAQQKRRIKSRLRALNKISAYQSHTAAGNILFPGEDVKKRVKSKILENVGDTYNKGIRIGNDNPMKQWMPK